MKRWITHIFLTSYLGILIFGLFSHALKFYHLSHPAMYFIVWDMYCGWSSYENRLHILGEGESGQFYELSPSPWGEMIPFGECGRQHYDYQAAFTDRLALNVLTHTRHEPIHRIYLIEESWPKKYNLPDPLWTLRYDSPKEKYTYRHLRGVYDREGVCLQRKANWLLLQNQLVVMDNPRLRRDAKQGHTFLATHPSDRHREDIVPRPKILPASYEQVTK